MTARRGPRTHHIRHSAAGGNEWECDCKVTGNGPATARAHQDKVGRAALSRMGDLNAYTNALINGAAGERESLTLIFRSSFWRQEPRLRRFLRPGYDRFGLLTLCVRWEGLAAAVAGGTFADVDEVDMLVMHIALALQGRFGPRLDQLWRLPAQDASLVRDAFAKNLAAGTLGQAEAAAR